MQGAGGEGRESRFRGQLGCCQDGKMLKNSNVMSSMILDEVGAPSMRRKLAGQEEN